MDDKTRVRSLRMADNIFFSMKHIAKLHKRSATKEIEEVLENYIRDFEKEHGPINLDDYK